MKEQFPDWSERLRDDPALRVQHKNFDAYELYGRLQNYVVPSGRDDPHFPAAGDTTTKSTFVPHGGIAPQRSMKPTDANASALKSIFEEGGGRQSNADAERFTMYHTDFRAPDIMSGLSAEDRKRLLHYLREVKKAAGPTSPNGARPSNGNAKTPTRQTKRV